MNAQYLLLYRNYAKAIRKLDEARKRKNLYDAMKVVRAIDDILADSRIWATRRPVGAPSINNKGLNPEPKTHNSLSESKKFVHRVYMGPILRWVEFQAASYPENLNDSEFYKLKEISNIPWSREKNNDRIEQKLFDDAYVNYWKHRKAFFNFLKNHYFFSPYREQIELAKEEMEYQAVKQFLGIKDNDNVFKEVHARIQKASSYVLERYRKTPKVIDSNQSLPTDIPESKNMVLLLFDCAEKAQLTGLEEGAAKEVIDIVNSLTPEKLRRFK